MASNRFTLNSPDGKDVASAALFVAKEVGGVMEMSLRFGGTEGRPSMTAQVTVLATDLDQRVLRVLGSASKRFTGDELGAIAVALLSLVYECDRDIYRRSEGLGPKTA